MHQPTILHLIDSLGRGGAENLLVNTVNAMKDHKHVIVYLHKPHDVASEFENAEVICLHKNSRQDLFSIAFQIRRIINEKKITVVHSHSYLTHILSRLASPRNIVLINSYHFADYQTRANGYIRNRMIFFDKLTYSKRVKIVAVSDFVKQVLSATCGYNALTIPNYIGDEFFHQGSSAKQWDGNTILKLVSIGNLKKEKNYELLIEAFEQLKTLPVQLDVYGVGNRLEHYRKTLAEKGIYNLNFKGGTTNVAKVLTDYHGYVMSSYSEACPLSPIEAMSKGLPLILSAIPALTEIAENNALYFEPGDPNGFVAIIRNILEHKIKFSSDTQASEKIIERYSKARYIDTVKKLYNPEEGYESQKRIYSDGAEIRYLNPFNGYELVLTSEGLCAEDKIVFPKINGAVRVAEQVNYTSNFGYQWNKFVTTQMDTSINTIELSKQRFFAATHWNEEDLTGANILEAGSGAGRFSQVVLAHTKARLYSFDYSNAVEANFENNRQYGERFKLFQASIYEMPFEKSQFDKVFCFGVLQHTPDVKKSVESLASMVRKGGELVVDFYPITGWWTKVHIKYILRPYTRRLGHEKLLEMIEKNADWMIGLSQFFNTIGIGKFTNRFIPICDIQGTLPKGLTKAQLREWVVLDTFDMFSPEYDQPQKLSVVESWFREAGFEQVQAGFISYGNSRGAIVKGIK